MPRVLLISLTICEDDENGHVKMDPQSSPVLHMALKNDQVPAFREIWRRGMAHEHGQPQVLYEFSDKMDEFLKE